MVSFLACQRNPSAVQHEFAAVEGELHNARQGSLSGLLLFQLAGWARAATSILRCLSLIAFVVTVTGAEQGAS